MKFKNFTLLKLTICYCIGILLAYFFVLPLKLLVLIFGSLLLILTALFFRFKNQLKEQTTSFSCIAFLSLCVFGAISYSLSLPKNQTQHFSHFIKAENTLIFKIEKRLKPNAYYYKYYADVIQINNNASHGQILIQQKKDSSQSFQPDQTFISYANLSPIKKARNPHQFDYKRYLKNQGVYFQSYVSAQNSVALPKYSKTYNGWNYQLINNINNGLKAHKIGKDELAIINALLLGQKQDISNQLYDSYTNSGAIHILAVSGLHVSIILLILHFALAPVFNFKYGSIYKSFTIVIILWAFAFLTGASASVIRATSMFTLITFAINLKRKTTIYNTLVASAFIILLFKPQFIFDVGFQLSYAAVFSIVAFQPLIENLWKSPPKLLKLLWKTFTVTLAAQFGIIPISLLYFHQFPGLFWLSNLVIIPLLPLILGLGVLCIVCILCHIPFKITHLFVSLLERCLYGMNCFLHWISSFETLVFKDIYFNSLLMCASFLVIIAFYRFWIRFNFKRLAILCLGIIILQVSFLITHKRTNYNEFVVFHKTKSTQIALKIGPQLHLFTEDLKENYISKSYKVGSNISSVSLDSITPFFKINQQRIMVIDSTAIYDLKQYKPDVVILTQSPKLNLERLIKTLNPKKIIADGSNYKSYVKRWQETCKNKKGLFHSTEKGAFVFRF